VRYRTIVADPPWEYDATPKGRPGWRKGGGIATSAPLPYRSMSLVEIAALPIQELADPDGTWLFLWTTNRYLPAAFSLLAGWGFVYRQTIVWAKPSFPVGGCVTANAAEYLLVARRGHVGIINRWPGGSVVTAPKGALAGEHSKKPEIFLDLVERVAPGPYLELFARRQRLGWDTWGDEALCHVDLEAQV
jgi:N6-adenosine-specific RNA methylase IME4